MPQLLRLRIALVVGAVITILVLTTRSRKRPAVEVPVESTEHLVHLWALAAPSPPHRPQAPFASVPAPIETGHHVRYSKLIDRLVSAYPELLVSSDAGRPQSDDRVREMWTAKFPLPCCE